MFMDVKDKQQLTRAAAGMVLATGLLGVTPPAWAQKAPTWKPADICAKDSARGQCLLLERRARNDALASWQMMPVAVRRLCTDRVSANSVKSWRILIGCVEDEGRKAWRARAAAKRAREATALAQLQTRNEQASATTTSNDTGTDAARITSERDSFLALLAEQRKADAAAKQRKSGAPKASAATSESKRIAEEEASFMRQLAEQRKADKEAAERKAAAKKTAAAAAAATESKRVAEEEASFMRQLAAQRKADKEAAERKAEIKKVAAVKARQAAAQSCENRLKKVSASGSIQFALNSSELTGSAGTAVLDNLAKAVGDCEGKLAIVVEGHTDSAGRAAFNNRLSKARAETVAAYLNSKGVPADRISARGLGSSKPIASNATRSGRAQNRRIEFKVQ